MKKILLCAFVYFAILSPTLKAQTFSVTSDTVTATVYSTALVHDNITNTTTGSITVSWNVVATNFPADWMTPAAFGICDDNFCRNNDGDTLLWRIATGTPGNSYSSSNYLPGVTGVFDLSLNLASASVGTHWVTVALSDNAALYTKNVTFIINKMPTAVPAINTPNEISLYPNPANNEINVVYDGNNDVKSIAVYNIIGKMQSVYKVNGTSANLKIEQLASGIYFVRLYNSNGSVVSTRKFTKQ